MICIFSINILSVFADYKVTGECFASINNVISIDQLHYKSYPILSNYHRSNSSLIHHELNRTLKFTDYSFTHPLNEALTQSPTRSPNETINFPPTQFSSSHSIFHLISHQSTQFCPKVVNSASKSTFGFVDFLEIRSDYYGFLNFRFVCLQNS